jgi:hypothetical protein
MTYTVIYRGSDDLKGTFTFVSARHSKDHAWTEFIEKYAEEGQTPIAIMPGNHVVYFPQDLSLTQVA